MRETLKNLDALLSIRINLHEELPRHLKQWDIANGRATFRIPSEFEFDVTIVDEDPSEQLYFLDIRFLFTPAPEVPDSQFRVALEDRSNQALKSAGLIGCYDFLHDFVLTHKISTLRWQANEMSRGPWFGNVRVENVRRSLVVQYWTGLQTKNWIEIGISSGKSKDGEATWKGPETAKLGVRWFRGGVEAPTSDLEFDWTSLSMERVLKQVIARHISHILSSIEQGLSLFHIYDEGQTLETCSLSVSSAEPADCGLTLGINGQQSPCTVAIEPVVGRLVLSPHSALSARAEGELNLLKNPESTGAAAITRYLARNVQESTERQAAYCGWRTLKNLKIDNAGLKFAQDVMAISYFRGHSWGQIPWAIAALVNLGGESWWAVELYVSHLGRCRKLTLLTVHTAPIRP
ncbi:MAG: hypothetical protein INR71_06765 [Terriglobus roseus]|nr:hypothetical protein [Terriglobus roseus]